MAVAKILPCLALITYLPAQVIGDKQSCETTEASENFPCGTSYTVVGDFCFEPRGEDDGGGKSRFAADSACGMGGQLVEFRTRELWEAFLVNKKLDKKASYWIAGRKFGDKWYWRTKGSSNEIQELFWNSKADEESPQGCMMTMNSKWHVENCMNEYSWLCQYDGKHFYIQVSKLTFIEEDSSSSSFHFHVGDTVNFQCTGRSFQGMTMSWKKGNKEWTRDSEAVKEKGFVEFRSKSKGARNRTLGERCFVERHFSVRLKLVNRRFHRSNVTCCPKGGTESSCATRTIRVDFEDDARDPIVELVIPNNRRWQTIDDRLVYKCKARLGKYKAMTIAIVQNGKTWAKYIKWDSKEERAAGDPPSWFDKLTFKAVSSRGKERKAGYVIRLTITFRYIYAMNNASFGCYSNEVLYKVMGNVGLKDGDLVSAWTHFGVATLKPKAKIKLLDVPAPSSNGKIPVVACGILEVSCITYGSNKYNIRFVTETKTGSGTWSKTSNTLPDWAKVERLHEFTDDISGPSVEAVVHLNVTSVMATAKLTCRMKRGAGFTDDYINLNLEPKVGRLPPEIRPVFHDKGNSYVSVKCVSKVGSGDTHTWKIELNGNHTNVVFVSKDGGVEGLELRGIHIKLTSAFPDPVCGQEISSTLEVLRTLKEVNLTMTCYSLKLDNSISQADREKFSITYKFFRTHNPEAEEEEEDDDLPYILWALALLALVTILVLCYICARKSGRDVAGEAEVKDVLDQTPDERHSKALTELTASTLKATTHVSTKSAKSERSYKTSSTIPFVE